MGKHQLTPERELPASQCNYSCWKARKGLSSLQENKKHKSQYRSVKEHLCQISLSYSLVTTRQSSGIPYLGASELSERIKQPLRGCTSGQTPERLLLDRRAAQKRPAARAALCPGTSVTVLDEGLVHGSTILTHATTLGGGADVVGDRMAAPMDPDRLKSLGCSSLRMSAGFCTWAGSAETTNAGWGRQCFWRKGSGGQRPAQEKHESPVLRDHKRRQPPQAGDSSSLLCQG